MIDIKKLFFGEFGSTLRFEKTYDDFAFQLNEVNLKDVRLSGSLLRLEDGILCRFEEINATQITNCVRCLKDLSLNLQLKDGEWMFHVRRHSPEDDELEHLQINTHKWLLDEEEALRQELALNVFETPRCEPLCLNFESSDAIQPKEKRERLALFEQMSKIAPQLTESDG